MKRIISSIVMVSFIMLLFVSAANAGASIQQVSAYDDGGIINLVKNNSLKGIDISVFTCKGNQYDVSNMFTRIDSKIKKTDWYKESYDGIRYSCMPNSDIMTCQVKLHKIDTPMYVLSNTDYLNITDTICKNYDNNIYDTDFKLTGNYDSNTISKLTNILGGMLYGKIAYRACGFWIISEDDNSITCSFSLDVDTSWETSEELKKIVDDIVSKANQYQTDREKLEYLNNVICDKCEYDYAAQDVVLGSIEYSSMTDEQKDNYLTDVDPYGCLVKGKAICAGYTITMSYLCRKLGIPQIMVVSGSLFTYNEKSVAHAWNEVYVDGKWLMIDVTWDDGQDRNAYFLKTEEEFRNHHPMPEEDKTVNEYSKEYLIPGSTDLKIERGTVTVIVHPSKVKLSESSLKMTKGSKHSLSVDVIPATATNKNIKWESSNPGVASVNNLGEITAVGKGNTVITVSTEDGNRVSTCNVSVAVPASKIVLNKTSLNLKLGKTKTLKATVLPQDADNKNVIWKSSNTNIVTIDKNGKILARKVGKADITVSTVDSSIISRCTVNVIK